MSFLEFLLDLLAFQLVSLFLTSLLQVKIYHPAGWCDTRGDDCPVSSVTVFCGNSFGFVEVNNSFSLLVCCCVVAILSSLPFTGTTLSSRSKMSSQVASSGCVPSHYFSTWLIWFVSVVIVRLSRMSNEVKIG